MKLNEVCHLIISIAFDTKENDFDTKENATVRYDTVEVENRLKLNSDRRNLLNLLLRLYILYIYRLV